MAKIVALAWIQRYQMKDMDILSPLVPYNPILDKQLDHSDPAKLGVLWCFQDSLQHGNLHSNPDFQIQTNLKMEPLKDLKPEPRDPRYPRF